MHDPASKLVCALSDDVRIDRQDHVPMKLGTIENDYSQLFMGTHQQRL